MIRSLLWFWSLQTIFFAIKQTLFPYVWHCQILAMLRCAFFMAKLRFWLSLCKCVLVSSVSISIILVFVVYKISYSNHHCYVMHHIFHWQVTKWNKCKNGISDLDSDKTLNVFKYLTVGLYKKLNCKTSQEARYCETSDIRKRCSKPSEVVSKCNQKAFLKCVLSF